MPRVVRRGYAVITREWKAGDEIELELPLQVQPLTAAEQIAATRNKIALRHGPLIYNAPAVDQDISKKLHLDASFTAEWRDDFLGGVIAIRGQYTDGTPFLAIPNYARLNRNKDLPPQAGPAAQRPAQAGERRREPRPPASVVWLPTRSE